MKDKSYIRIGFFKDFEGEDSVLISADINGLAELKSVFHKLTNKNKTITTNNLNYLDKEHRILIKLVSGEKNEGLKLNKHNYEWKLTPEKWRAFKEKASSLYKNSVKGHHYLDSDSNENTDLQVKLSLNEYDLGFWKRFNSDEKPDPNNR